MDLERVQKVALKIILQEDYLTYEDALESLNLDTLRKRREKLCLSFAKKCVMHPKAKEMFPFNTPNILTNRDRECFYVQHAPTSRLCCRTIPQLQMLDFPFFTSIFITNTNTWSIVSSLWSTSYQHADTSRLDSLTQLSMRSTKAKSEKKILYQDLSF